VQRGDHVLYVGRLSREKGVLQLLDAAARSADPWPLRLVGSGPLEETLRRRAERPQPTAPARAAEPRAGALSYNLRGAPQPAGVTSCVVGSSVSFGIRVLPPLADFGQPRGRPRSNGPAMYCWALPLVTLA
jgi:hypothetical protein